MPMNTTGVDRPVSTDLRMIGGFVASVGAGAALVVVPFTPHSATKAWLLVGLPIGVVVLAAVLYGLLVLVRRVSARLGAAWAQGRSTAPGWAAARQRFEQMRAAYAAYECDALQVLRMPVLADVTVASTARFVEAFAEAQALDTADDPPREHAAAYVEAVDRACGAWRAANETAERIRLSRFSPEERAVLERVVKLLTVARETDSDPERRGAYAKARAQLARLQLAGIIQLPRAARAALETVARPALPA